MSKRLPHTCRWISALGCIVEEVLLIILSSRIPLLFTAATLLILFQGCSSTEKSTPSNARARTATHFDIPLRERAAVNPMQDLATYKITRKISMYYRLDLKKDNYWSPSLAATLKQYEGRMRACYTDRLNSQPGLKGAISFSFRLERGGTAVKDIARVGGSIKDLHLSDCLRQRVGEIPVKAPKDMQGLITWEFNVLEGVAQSTTVTSQPINLKK